MSRFYDSTTGRQIVTEPPPAHRNTGGPSPSAQYVGSTQATPPPPASLVLLQQQQREREAREREERERERAAMPGKISHSMHILQRLNQSVIIAGHTNMPSHGSLVPVPTGRTIQVATPPHGSQVPPQADSLLSLLQRYPVMWQGLLALKTDHAAVQMHFVHGNRQVAQESLPINSEGTTPLRIAQRMRLEQAQIEGVARKMQVSVLMI